MDNERGRHSVRDRASWVTIPLILVLMGCFSGCASPPVPTEATIEALRISHDQTARLVASGQVPPEQARDQFYSKLADVDPRLPGLDALIDYRRQLRGQVASGQLTPEQAGAKLNARESEMLARWPEMAAQYAAEQRRLEQMQNNYERGYDQQMRIEQGSGIRNLPPNTPK